jgi:HEAT repeat protein
MTKLKVESMTTDQLIAQFADYALAQDKVMYDHARLYNAILPKMEVVEDELRRRGVYEQLQTLFTHENMTVRLESARRLMTIMPEQVRPIFAQIQKSGQYPWAARAAGQLGYLDRHPELSSKGARRPMT